MYTKNCLECNNKFTTNDNKQKFCCSRCSALFNNRIRKQNGTLKHSKETRKKISNSIKLKVKKKIKYCKVCGSEQGKCKQPQMCKQYLIRKKSINLQKLGFDFSKFGTEMIFEEYYKVYSYLVYQYEVEKKTLREICNLHNMTCETSLVKILDMYDIQRRNLSQSLLNAVSKNRIALLNINSKSSYKHGWHTTWNNIQVYYRSSYELDLCKELDKQKIHYFMENLKIPYYNEEQKKECISIPDFYIPSKNLIIEIKSDFTYSKLDMISRFKQYKHNGYDYQLILEHKNYGKRLPETKKSYVNYKKYYN